MTSRLKLPRDALAGVALLGLCAWAFWLTTGLSSVPALLSQNVPPTFFPRLVIALIALLALVLIARAALTREPPDVAEVLAPEPQEVQRANQTVSSSAYLVVLVTAVSIVAAAIVMPWLGTWLTLVLVCVVLPRCWGERRWTYVIGLAIGLPAAVYLVFSVALSVRFPSGVIGSLLGQA